MVDMELRAWNCSAAILIFSKSFLSWMFTTWPLASLTDSRQQKQSRWYFKRGVTKMANVWTEAAKNRHKVANLSANAASTRINTGGCKQSNLKPINLVLRSSFFIHFFLRFCFWNLGTQLEILRCNSSVAFKSSPCLEIALCRISFFFLPRVSAVDASQRECLSCSLFRSKCNYFDSLLSPTRQHVLLNCRGVLRDVALCFTSVCAFFFFFNS